MYGMWATTAAQIQPPRTTHVNVGESGLGWKQDKIVTGRKVQPIRHTDYRQLPNRDWITVLRFYRLQRSVGLEREKVRREIKGPVLEPLMWALDRKAEVAKAAKKAARK